MKFWAALWRVLTGAGKETKWSVSVAIPLGSGWRDNRVNDRKLSEHFSVYELTATSFADLQAQNRDLNGLQLDKLSQLAELLETVRLILEVPIIISSAYRCFPLNMKVGGSQTSQHMRSEAADFIPKGMDLPLAFSLLRKAAKEGNIQFGQLIYEKQDRPYGKEWLHISLGYPYRDKSLSGQVMTNNDGKYHMVEEIKVA